MTANLGHNNVDNKMIVDIDSNRNLSNLHSYVQMSTTTAVAAGTAATPKLNNNHIDCPPTPYTSNTTSTKQTSSHESYLSETLTPTPQNDMSIDEPETPKLATQVASPRRRHLTP
jgi:hypothetical protein